MLYGPLEDRRVAYLAYISRDVLICVMCKFDNQQHGRGVVWRKRFLCGRTRHYGTFTEKEAYDEIVSLIRVDMSGLVFRSALRAVIRRDMRLLGFPRLRLPLRDVSKQSPEHACRCQASTISY